MTILTELSTSLTVFWYLLNFPQVHTGKIRRSISQNRPRRPGLGVEYSYTLYLTSALDGGGVVNAPSRTLYPRERLRTHFRGGWVDPRADLEGCENLAPRRDYPQDHGHLAMKAHKWSGVTAPLTFTSAQDAGDWSAPCPGRFSRVVLLFGCNGGKGKGKHNRV